MESGKLQQSAPVFPSKTPDLGIFVERPVARFLAGAILPWITVIVLMTIASSLDEKIFRFMCTGQIRIWCAFWMNVPVPSILIIIPFVIFGTPAKLALRMIPRKFMIFRGGWVMAAVCVVTGTLISLVTAYLLWNALYEADERGQAYCEQWDTTHNGELLPNPVCHVWSQYQSPWPFLLGAVPGLVYWLVRYRPRLHVSHVNKKIKHE